MEKNYKCRNCGEMLDNDAVVCPRCGQPFVKDEITEDEEVSNFIEKLKNPSTIENNIDNVENKENITEDEVKQQGKGLSSLIKFPSREMKGNLWWHVSLFLIGFIGLNILAFIISFIIGIVNVDALSTFDTTAALNFGLYFILFGAFLIFVNTKIIDVLKDYKKPPTWLKGLVYGLIILGSSIIISLITYNFYPDTVDTTINDNESTIRSITTSYPVLSFIVFGFLGPICEEFTYRAGLFSGIKKLNRVAAYLTCTIVFGLIHFSFDFTNTDDVIVELLNLPNYMVSGALLCYFYERDGIAVSITAHMTNNVISVLATILFSVVRI